MAEILRLFRKAGLDVEAAVRGVYARAKAEGLGGGDIVGVAQLFI